MSASHQPGSPSLLGLHEDLKGYCDDLAGNSVGWIDMDVLPITPSHPEYQFVTADNETNGNTVTGIKFQFRWLRSADRNRVGGTLNLISQRVYARYKNDITEELSTWCETKAEFSKKEKDGVDHDSGTGEESIFFTSEEHGLEVKITYKVKP
ncbi:hypothetical protein P280DRAFT_485611 [Massarina eburnea CBS 473.64]|uniref:Uncharacterized protein n=1 Tax=Massarina eburnea CBS 473.64 TaxID=1395130 RepID=A0A6A6RFZ9_9PLEO|nr:hypothetical protein P280DRAFT_485611 [Massarina eburnea CBS 473.64]